MSDKNLLRAKKKVMDLLARRDHSEKELRQKLGKFFTLLETDQAIEFARENNWLAPPAEISERASAMLHRKLKGSGYIRNFLNKKGLPQIPCDSELEMDKALELVRSKWGDTDLTPASPLTNEFTHEEKLKIGRFLESRGFDHSTIRKVIYEKL